MFASGSPDLQPYFEDILLALSDTIAKSPKKISISGHTDAMPFIGRPDYGNWELSAQRANAARRTLERSEERRVGKECRSRGWPVHYKERGGRVLAVAVS